MAYKQVSCHDCGLLMPANEATKRNIISGSSSGSSVNYQHPDQTTFTSRAYFSSAYMCHYCAAEIDKTNAASRRNSWIFWICFISFFVFVFFYSVAKDNPPSNSTSTRATSQTTTTWSEKDVAVCVIREWDGKCTEYAWKK